MRQFKKGSILIMKRSKKIVSVLMVCIITALSVCTFSASGASQEQQLRDKISQLESRSQQIEKEIKKLKAKNASQQAIANAIQSKINNTQQQIDACNAEMNRINAQIAQNKADIDKKNQEIADTKETFKKRLRAIYMSNSSSSAQILLGAQDFSEYLQLEQLMDSVSSHDKAIIDDIVAAVKELEAKKAENENLLNSQVGIKNTVVAKQKELRSQQNEVNAVINSISADTKQLTNENNSVEAQIKSAQNALNALFASMRPNLNIVYDGNGFKWPVPYTRNLSQGYKGSSHWGLDISAGGIAGKEVRASATGVVSAANGGWTKANGTSGMASYGNYVILDHGTVNGKYIQTLYAHMMRIAVSPGQQVQQGQVIGYVGNTGRVFGSGGGYHLHFEVRENKVHTNPYKYLS